MVSKDNDRKLRLFLDRCRDRNIKLNADKFRLRQNEVPYIGHLLTSVGLKEDPEKVQAINEMPRPTDVKGVQRILGMVNYLSRFCRHLSDHYAQTSLSEYKRPHNQGTCTALLQPQRTVSSTV